MLFSHADASELVGMATEALSRYKLRTSLSVLGIVLGVAAVIAMMSVSEGAARDALSQVEALGLDNLVARSRGGTSQGGRWLGLTVQDVEQAAALMPHVHAISPLLERPKRITYGDVSPTTRVLGVHASYQAILRLNVDHGRFLADTDDQHAARTCVLGAGLARSLFGYRDPLGDTVRIGGDYYRVVGVLREQRADPKGGAALAWRDVNQAAFVPFAALSARPEHLVPSQPVDELWLQLDDTEQVEALAQILDHTLATTSTHPRFEIVVPRELLAQRYRTQRTFSVVVGSVAALALLIGGIGIMNIMLTSVVERTREIGIRRTAGATRRDVTLQFLVEALMMTIGGGVVGMVLGAATSWAIASYADWSTHVSMAAVALGFVVSLAVGLAFGLYPAMKAAALEPIDAMRYE
ncbi:MAG: ABC transporter permease [Vicinamibacterales bacterium]